jgi:hypothetical protein
MSLASATRNDVKVLAELLTLASFINSVGLERSVGWGITRSILLVAKELVKGLCLTIADVLDAIVPYEELGECTSDGRLVLLLLSTPVPEVEE